MGDLGSARPRPGVRDKAGPLRSGESRRPLRGISRCLYPPPREGYLSWRRGSLPCRTAAASGLRSVAWVAASGSACREQVRTVARGAAWKGSVLPRRPGAVTSEGGEAGVRVGGVAIRSGAYLFLFFGVLSLHLVPPSNVASSSQVVLRFPSLSSSARCSYSHYHSLSPPASCLFGVLFCYHFYFLHCPLCSDTSCVRESSLASSALFFSRFSSSLALFGPVIPSRGRQMASLHSPLLTQT
jgi:hypothetical protein